MKGILHPSCRPMTTAQVIAHLIDDKANPVQRDLITELDYCKEQHDTAAFERNINYVMPILDKLGW